MGDKNLFLKTSIELWACQIEVLKPLIKILRAFLNTSIKGLCVVKHKLDHNFIFIELLRTSIKTIFECPSSCLKETASKPKSP